MPGVAWIAAASYGLYLVHKPIYHLVRTHAGGRLDGPDAFAFDAYAAASLAGGASLHYAVERPFLRWRDCTTARGRRVAATPSEVAAR